MSSELGTICLPFPLSIALVIGAGSSAGVSSYSNVCCLGVSSTSEVVLVKLHSALADRVSSVCTAFLLAPSVFVWVLDHVALSGGSGGSGGSLCT